MAFVYGTGQLILFGGTAAFTSPVQGLGDTWAWDGTDWTPLDPADSPPSRAQASMVHERSDQLVLFGGRSGSGVLGDTWVWDGTNWAQLSPTSTPTARSDAAVASDTVQGQVVLFGGADAGGNAMGDTWTFDGTNWTHQSVTASGPDPRSGGTMAYDEASGRVVMNGGLEGGTDLSSSWAWDPFGRRWTATAIAGPIPPGRHWASMAYDHDTGQLVLFGGASVTQGTKADTWVYGDPLASQSITLTSTPPATALVGDSYTVVATGGASGNPVLFSVDGSFPSGVCDVSATGTVRFLSVGRCVLDLDQAGNASYYPSHRTLGLDVVASLKAPQVIVFNTAPPTDAVVGDTYSPAATGGDSGIAVVFSIDGSSTPGACTLSASGVVTFTGPGTCLVDANQAGNDNYLPADQVQQPITVVDKAAQVVAFTNQPPSSPTYGGSWTPTFSRGGSNQPVQLGVNPVSTGCRLTGDSISFSATGTCLVTLNQDGDANYAPATQVTRALTVAAAPLTVQVSGTQAYGASPRSPSTPSTGS